MYLFTATTVVLAFIFASAAVLLWRQASESPLKQLYIGFLWVASLWMLSNAVADLAATDQLLRIASGVAMIAGGGIATLMLFFTHLFTFHNWPRLQTVVMYVAPTVFFSLYAFSPYCISQTIPLLGEPSQIIPGRMYALYAMWLFGSLLYSCILLAGKLRHDSATKKHQTMYVLGGFCSLLLGGLLFSVILPLFGELRFFNLAPQFASVFAVSTGYAILRHNLLDVRVFIQRGLIYSILFLLVASLFFIALHLVSTLLLLSSYTEYNHAQHVIAGVLATALGTFSVPHLNQLLRRATDPVFFTNAYDYTEALQKLSHSVNQHIQLKNIITTSSLTLRNLLRAKDVTITPTPLESSPTKVPANPRPADTFTVPIYHNQTLVGSIAVGPKQSGQRYSKRDVALVETFSNQIATAFEKARLYKEVEDYSHTLELRVAERTKEIERLQADRSRIVLDISHQLQTPLTVVKNELHTLKTNGGQSAHVRAFEKSIDDISNFIYSLLHLAGLEADTTPKTTYNLSQQLEELVEYYTVISENQDITLRATIQPGLYIHGIRSMIEESISNVVSNAVKYMKPMTSGSKRAIAIVTSAAKDQIHISITDTGIGMQKDSLPHIFEQFYRDRSQHESATPGTGLGLAICKKIIELHSGTITAHSTLNVGTTIEIVLPQAHTGTQPPTQT